MAHTVPAQTGARLIPKKGLFLSTHNINWGMGSEVSFFTPDKKQHHYYFTWWDQDVDSSRRDEEVLILGSANTAVYGSYRLQQSTAGMSTRISCNWNLASAGVADIIFLRIWQPYFQDAAWYDGKGRLIGSLADFHDSVLVVKSPLGLFRFRAGHPFRVKTDLQPEPGPKDYTRRSQYLLFSEDNIPVNGDRTLERSFRVEQLSADTFYTHAAQVSDVTLAPVDTAWRPPAGGVQVLPRPQILQLLDGNYVVPKSRPSPVSSVVEQFRSMLQQQWQTGDQYYPSIEVRINNKMHPEGYVMDVELGGVQLQYNTEQGLQHALHTLVQLTQWDGEQLVIPAGHIADSPRVDWRGIHMFTGPTAWSLHRRMYERVLMPLKMNKLVLQCEQAAWKSRPELKNPISAPLADLRAEFDFLRTHHVEPIPLIQSLGHMEWFFKPRQNRFMAVNPDYPYTLNPEIPAAQAAVKALWDEAFDLLHPRVMHIGFDEIGMIGFHLSRDREIDFWKRQLSFLHQYAREHRATLMLWGDMGLAPGEGPDACNGLTKERAALLRSTIPRGSFVADWHYLNNPDPAVYKTNLRIWQQNGNRPLASPWLWPNNVRGFVQAAVEEGAGLLQTTWADFESSEFNMLQNMEQFGAYVLALDYAWSGRQELPEALPYDPVAEWASRFYSQAKPAAIRKGWRLAEDLRFVNITRAAASHGPLRRTLRFPQRSSAGFRMEANTHTILPEGSPVATVRFYNGGQEVQTQTLRYGVELRSASDRRPIYAAMPGCGNRNWYVFFPQPYLVDRVEVEVLHPGAGLRLTDWILLE